ncbi:MAG: DNA polymerase III subunit alpha [Candidatus Gribaldobacteria bacterium]|nr:DNA polymerase III subunit alpha [Candidatus Gribaldobacteria bacterium]
MLDRRTGVDDKSFHLILLVKNEVGYKNLFKLVTKAHLEGFYYKPRVDDELLAKYSEGLIALSACIKGKVPWFINVNKPEEAEKIALNYQKIFGADSFYLELQDHPHIPEQQKANDGLIALSRKLNIPLVVTNDTHYLHKEDADVQDILMLINTGAKIDDPERLTMKNEDFSLKLVAEMVNFCEKIGAPEAITNTQKIVEMCNFEFKLGQTRLPTFTTPSGQSADDYLKELCLIGLDSAKKKITDKETALERLNYELSVIAQTGFASYFLIVQDFVRWAKENHIVVGPGRGSAGGSLVAFLTDITEVDPLAHNLLFERFLNPARISMPDIDLDFADRRRDEVINYVSEKYGREKVAQIITFGTMAARAAIRDVGRAMNLPYSFCDQVAKMIPMGNNLKETLEKVTEFRQLYTTDENAKKLIDVSKKLEGVARHASTHACGIIISDQPLDDIVPLQHPSQDEAIIVTQYEMHSIEDLGLLKMDFLGLKNLTIIEDTLARVYVVRNEQIDLANIPQDDPETFKIFQEAKTTGVFQLESDGLKKYLKELHPTCFEDIVAMVALYRPGPIQFIPDYINRKHGRKQVQYLHPKLEPILKNTQGICVYQEQLMQIARDIAGFSLAEADILRKAIGKKIPELLKAQKEKFVGGAIKNEVSQKVAEELWEWVLPFAAYGFNRSHSVAYGIIAYNTAYLKSHYPPEFMSALLTSEKSDVERIAFLIDECKSMGIEVLAPDINESFRNFSVVPNESKIRFGLLAIKNVGSNIVKAILEERKTNGVFTSFSDFASRVNDKDFNKKSLESMAKTGVFDKLAERGKILDNMESILAFNRDLRKEKTSPQKSLFEMATSSAVPSLLLREVPPTPTEVKLVWEKELLGLYISDHPLHNLKKLMQGRALPIKELRDNPFNYAVRIGVIISSIKKVITKKGQPMLFMKVEDLTDKAEIVVFPSMLEQKPELFQENKIVFITGKLDKAKEEIPTLICQDIEEVLEV